MFLILGTSSSCDKGFEELNADPNKPTAVPSGLLVADAVRVAGNVLHSTFVGGDMGACWSQQWAKVQYNDEARYTPRESIIGFIWDGFYEDVVSTGVRIEKLAIEEENPATQAVGLILQAYGFSVLTDSYGAIPFSEAMKTDEGIFYPAYDSQEAVFNGIFSLLDQANDLLETGEGSLIAGSDLLYGGDLSKWQKFANSLKFRSLMRISGVKDVSAELSAIASGRAVFGSNDDEAKLIYLALPPNANPIYETIVDGTRNEWKINSVMVETLETLADPRLTVYAQPNSEGVIRGKPSGYANVPNNDYDYANVSPIGLHYLDPTFPGYFMSYSELMFLMAEAAQRGLIGGSAADFYNEGISANMAANGIADASAYLAQATVAYNDGDWENRIGTQKWIALFGQGNEAWTEWRRTGYPVLQPAFENTLGSIPSRYTWPSAEQSVNVANFEAAEAANGDNALDRKVWWMN